MVICVSLMKRNELLRVFYINIFAIKAAVASVFMSTKHEITVMSKVSLTATENYHLAAPLSCKVIN